MTDVRKIREKMYGGKISYRDMAQMLGIGTTTFQMKMSNKSEFKQSEIQKICTILNIPLEEAHTIFFAR